MAIRATAGRLVLIAMRHLEMEARKEERDGRRSDLTLKWLNWLLVDKRLAGTKTTWPPVGQEEFYEELIRLRDVEHLSFKCIGGLMGRDESTVSQMYRSLKRWLKTL